MASGAWPTRTQFDTRHPSHSLWLRYQELGGQMTLNVVKGGAHDYWAGWFQCPELVDFVICNEGLRMAVLNYRLENGNEDKDDHCE